MIRLIEKISKSGQYAINGIKDTFKEELMARVQFSFGLIQFLLALILKFDKVEIVIIFAFWMILTSQEIMNTAVENVVDLVSKNEKTEFARRSKDSAAGSVFLLSIVSWIIFIVLAFDNIKELI